VRISPYRDHVTTDARVVAALCDVDPTGQPRLTSVLKNLDPVAWWSRYLDTVAAPLLWLYATWGIVLEAHQQNSIVHLDETGWPVAARYRDNQGWYFKSTQASRLQSVLPGTGVESDTIVDDDVVDERFGYYLGINHLFGVVAALGATGLVPESALLSALRSFLHSQPDEVQGTVMVQRLLTSPTLRCKSNLLTRIAGMDELVGPVASQSVYVDVANPLVKQP